MLIVKSLSGQLKFRQNVDVMQETFSLFHSRDKATDRPVTSRGGGGGGGSEADIYWTVKQ